MTSSQLTDGREAEVAMVAASTASTTRVVIRAALLIAFAALDAADALLYAMLSRKGLCGRGRRTLLP